MSNDEWWFLSEKLGGWRGERWNEKRQSPERAVKLDCSLTLVQRHDYRRNNDFCVEYR